LRREVEGDVARVAQWRDRPETESNGDFDATSEDGNQEANPQPGATAEAGSPTSSEPA
jgi:hypothetical protein